MRDGYDEPTHEYAVMRQGDRHVKAEVWIGPYAKDQVWLGLNPGEPDEIVSAHEYCKRWIKEAIEDGFRTELFYVVRRPVSDWEKI